MSTIIPILPLSFSSSSFTWVMTEMMADIQSQVRDGGASGLLIKLTPDVRLTFPEFGSTGFISTLPIKSHFLLSQLDFIFGLLQTESWIIQCHLTSFFFLKFYLSIAALVFSAVRGLALVAVSRGYSLVAVHGPLELRLRALEGSVVAAVGPSCPWACGTFPDQGSNCCPLHCKVRSYPRDPQGSPLPALLGR